VNIGLISPKGNFLNQHALLVAPEAEAPGGPVFRLNQIAAKIKHDIDLLCSDEAFELCLVPEVDPNNCRMLVFQADEAKWFGDTLAKEPDNLKRMNMMKMHVIKVFKTNPDSLEYRAYHARSA